MKVSENIQIGMKTATATMAVIVRFNMILTMPFFAFADNVIA